MKNPTVEDFTFAAVKRYLVPFCIAMKEKWITNWHHEVIAQKLEDAVRRLEEEGKPTNIIIQLPPRHGKSEEVSVHFPAWVLGQHPEWPVMLASYSAELAEDFGLKTRDIIESPEYQYYFKTRLRPDVKAKGRWLTTKQGPIHEDGSYDNVPAGGGFTAAGVGGAITGRGFKLGIIDDPIKNREEAESELMREKIWEWWKSTFHTRQEGASIKIVIATRWHDQDLIGKLIEQEAEFKKAGADPATYEHWDVISFGAIAEEDEENRKKGEALWPSMFSVEELKIKENAMGLYEFSALYQQHPIPSEKQVFKREWFKYFEEYELKGKNLRYYTLVDLAISEKQNADNTVILTVAKELGSPNIYRIEETAGNFDPGETIEAIFAHAVKYRPDAVGLETVAYQKALRYFIEEEMRKRAATEKPCYFRIYELKRNQTTAKEIRIKGLVPLYKLGVIFHRRSDVELEKELLSFPGGKHDDRIDAEADITEVLENTMQESGSQPQEAIPTSDLQGTLNSLDEVDPVFDGEDIATMSHGKATRIPA